MTWKESDFLDLDRVRIEGATQSVNYRVDEILVLNHLEISNLEIL